MLGRTNCGTCAKKATSQLLIPIIEQLKVEVHSANSGVGDILAVIGIYFTSNQAVVYLHVTASCERYLMSTMWLLVLRNVCKSD